MTLLLVVLVVILDQISKHLITVNAWRLPIDILPGIFSINMAENRGAAFSILQGKVLLFIVISIVAVILITIILAGLNRGKAALIAHGGPGMTTRIIVTESALCLVMGGAIGNLIDRIRFGYVVDFLDFKIWPVFNIADSAITVGMVVLVIIAFTANKRNIF